MDHSKSGSFVDRILQARILEWVAYTPARDFSDPGTEPTAFMSLELSGGYFIPRTIFFCHSYGLSSSHVWMWPLDHKSWTLKNRCLWTVMLEKTLERPLDFKETKPVNPKGNQWIFIGSTDAEAEVPIFWSPPIGADLLEKSLMLRKAEARRKRGQKKMRCLDDITDSMDK